MTKQIIVVTGISGSGSRSFCKNVEEYYNSNTNKKAMVFQTGDLITEIAQNSKTNAPIPEENILNFPLHTIKSLRGQAFDHILDEISKGEFDIYIIDMHAQFFWNDVYSNAFDWKYLDDLNPDKVAVMKKGVSYVLNMRG